MTGYLLDTNIISDVIRSPDGIVARHLEELGPRAAIVTSIIVAAELHYGCARKGSAKLRARVGEILATIPIMPLECPADSRYGRIRAELEGVGKPIGMNDLLIASHALALGLTLVTDNMREFSRIRGLKVENWLER